MAFIGIFVVAWLLVLILIAVGCLILFVFIPSLVLAIINLVQGVKNNWPKHNIILLSISAPIAAIFITLLTVYLIWRFCFYVPPYIDGSSSSKAINQMLFLAQYYKYLIF